MHRTLLMVLCVVTLLSVSLTAQTAKKENGNDDLYTARLAASYGEFRVASTAASDSVLDLLPANLTAADFNVKDRTTREYVTADNRRLRVENVLTTSPAAAYSLLAEVSRAADGNRRFVEWTDAEAFALIAPSQLFFIKDRNLVRVVSANQNADSSRDDSSNSQLAITDATTDEPRIEALGRLIAASIEGEAGTTPVLLQHLPAWEQVQPRAAFATTANVTRAALGRDSVLDVLDYAGGTLATLARYTRTANGDFAASPDNSNAALLIVVEHLTPQLAGENHRRIEAAVNERRAIGQPLPSVFKREGNYLVFVFDAPDAANADALASQVKYEQDVRWLGANPFAQQRAEQAYTRMTLGLMITSFKTAGLGVLLCIIVGITIGGYVFMRRRAQSVAADLYTDAGGMVRLNIDDLADTDKLLRASNEPPQ